MCLWKRAGKLAGQREVNKAGKEDTQAGTPWEPRLLRSCKQFAFSLCGISGH